MREPLRFVTSLASRPEQPHSAISIGPLVSARNALITPRPVQNQRPSSTTSRPFSGEHARHPVSSDRERARHGAPAHQRSYWKRDTTPQRKRSGRATSTEG